MERVNPYYAYYTAQIGGGGSSLPYFRSRFRVQAGRGWFGNLFRSAWSHLSPLVSNAAKHAGAEALHVGSNMMKDVIANPNESLKSVISRQGKEGLMKIAKAAAAGARPAHPSAADQSGANVQSGKGRISRRQSAPRRRRARTAPTRGLSSRRRRQRQQPLPNNSSIRDIFSPPSP